MTAVAESVPTTGKQAASGRFEVRSLTGLRIVAAVWVLLFHWKFTPGAEFSGFKQALRPVLDSGYLGVDLFYVISGFVITLTYLDTMGSRPGLGAWGRFWWARVCRVWPAYAVVTVLFGVWLLWRRSVEAPGFPIAYQIVQPDLGWWSWVKQLLLVQLWGSPYFDGVSFVGATWSVSAEATAYLVFPVLVLVLFRLKRLPWWVLAVGAVALLLPGALRDLRTGEVYWEYSWLLRIMAGFASGALVCLAVRRLRASEELRERASRWATPLSWLLVVEIVLVLWWGDPSRGNGPFERYGLASLVFPLLIGCLALSDRGPAGWLARPGVVLGGRISYSVYLVHIPLYEVFWTFQRQYPAIAPGGSYTAFLVPNLPIVAIGLGWLLWFLVEEPARHRLRGLFARAPRPPAESRSKRTTRAAG
ncbi:MAG: acyltransferase family protein [Janthinobacterium lividum]